MEYFFTDADAAFFASLGLNCIRIAFNYRHFESDLNPRVLLTSGFKHLDRVISLCAKHGIYTILDCHTAPGGQNPDWHADAGIHIPLLWTHKDFQDRLVWLWGQLAEHYKDNKWVAGYNPLNEPCDSYHTRLVSLYDRLHDTIRRVDSNHALFWDGNTFASDFSQFGDSHTRWTNSAYGIHDYSLFGFPSAPETYTSTPEQQRRLRRSYEKKKQWMAERGLCVWNGEFGPVYARPQYDGGEIRANEINVSRYQVLKDQLAIYNEDRLSWSIWLYKDIGFQGMVHVNTESKYMTLLKDFLAKKQRLAPDAWGADSSYVQKYYQPLLDLVKTEVAPKEEHQHLYPWPVWKLEDRVSRLSRSILVAEFLVKEWAEHFKGLELEQLDELAKSFLFEQCVKREGLNAVLTENARLVKEAEKA